MASVQVVALPRLRLACRVLGRGADDPDLVLAEAGALLSWARAHGRVSAPWLVVDGGRVEVAAPVPPSTALPDGVHERELAPGRWAALDAEVPCAADVIAAASTVRARCAEPLADADEPVFARLTDAGATVHVRIREAG